MREKFKNRIDMKFYPQLLLVSFLFVLFNRVDAQEKPSPEIWYKLSPEIRLSFEDAPWEIRWRPDDHILIPGKFDDRTGFARIDLMLGANIGAFKLFSYTKVDEFQRVWTGARFDGNFAFFDKKFLLNLHGRYFFGLNERSADHYYLIQYPRYRAFDNISIGALGLGKWISDKPFTQGHWFVGPSVDTRFPHGFNLHLAYTKSVFYEDVYMLFVRLGYKIKLK